jgi:hypothetical protein
METLPIGLYLDRKSRESMGISGNPNRIDIQAATEVWYQKGIEDGMEQARASCDAAIAKQQEECQLSIEAARRLWSETESGSLARQIESAAAAIKADIADAAARVLKPLVAQAIIGQALAKLASEIEKLLSHDDAINLKISGPADLVSELRKQIPPQTAVTLLAGDKPEITVFANKTVIETRLSEWLARVGVDSHAKEQER